MADFTFDIGGSTKELRAEVAKAADDIAKLDTLAKDIGEGFDGGKKALAAMVLSGKAATAEFSDLLAKVKAGKAESDQFAAAMKQVEDAIGGAAKEADSLGSMLKGALTGEALSNVGDFLSGFSEKGVEAVDAMRKLQAQTGLVGEGLKAARADADELFLAGVGENVSEAIGVIASARKELGTVLDKEGLGDFTKTAAGIGKAFDTDVNEVLAKSRTFIKNFGLEGKEAGDLVALGMRNAANADGDFLDTLAEYSPLMKKAGLDAETFTGILTKGVQEGARNTDVLADSIKEAGIRLQAGDISTALKDISGPVADAVKEITKAGEAGSLSTIEVIQRSTAAIGKAFDAGQISDQMRSKLQVAIAGTPAEDIGADLYQRIFSAPIDTAALTQEATKAGEQIAGALGPKTIFESLSRNFDLITTKVSEFAAPVIAGLGGVLTTFGQIAPAVSLVIPLLPTLATGFSTVWAAATGPVGLVIAGIAAVGAAFYLLYNNVKPFADAVDAAFSFVMKGIDTVAPAFEAFGEVLFAVGELLYTWLITPFEIAFDVIGEVVSAIVGAGGASFDASKFFESLGKVVAVVVDWFKGAAKGIKDLTVGLKSAAAGFKSFAADAIGAVDDLFSKV